MSRLELAGACGFAPGDLVWSASYGEVLRVVDQGRDTWNATMIGEGAQLPAKAYPPRDLYPLTHPDVPPLMLLYYNDDPTDKSCRYDLVGFVKIEASVSRLKLMASAGVTEADAAVRLLTAFLEAITRNVDTKLIQGESRWLFEVVGATDPG